MTRVFGIDTSVLVRLLAGEPPGEYERCVARLTVLVEEQDFEIFASNERAGLKVLTLDRKMATLSNAQRLQLPD